MCCNDSNTVTKIIRISIFLTPLLCFAVATPALAAELKEPASPLALNQPIERELALEATNSYAIQLNADDYVAGWVEQRGITVVANVFSPDGALVRGFSGPHQGKREFAFIADTAGAYRLELRTPTKAEATHTGEPLLGWELPPEPGVRRRTRISELARNPRRRLDRFDRQKGGVKVMVDALLTQVATDLGGTISGKFKIHTTAFEEEKKP